MIEGCQVRWSPRSTKVNVAPLLSFDRALRAAIALILAWSIGLSGLTRLTHAAVAADPAANCIADLERHFVALRLLAEASSSDVFRRMLDDRPVKIKATSMDGVDTDATVRMLIPLALLPHIGLSYEFVRNPEDAEVRIFSVNRQFLSSLPERTSSDGTLASSEAFCRIDRGNGIVAASVAIDGTPGGSCTAMLLLTLLGLADPPNGRAFVPGSTEIRLAGSLAHIGMNRLSPIDRYRAHLEEPRIRTVVEDACQRRNWSDAAAGGH